MDNYTIHLYDSLLLSDPIVLLIIGSQYVNYICVMKLIKKTRRARGKHPQALHVRRGLLTQAEKIHEPMNPCPHPYTSRLSLPS